MYLQVVISFLVYMTISGAPVVDNNSNYLFKQYRAPISNQPPINVDRDSSEEIGNPSLVRSSPRPTLISNIKSSAQQHSSEGHKGNVQRKYRPRNNKFKKSPKYNYEYSVPNGISGNLYGHKETRNGQNTEGSYFVNLPDGRKQIVTYYVRGDSGYVAKVTYEGEAVYPVVAKSIVSVPSNYPRHQERNQQLKGYRYPNKGYDVPADFDHSRSIEFVDTPIDVESNERAILSAIKDNTGERLRHFQIITVNSSSSEEEHDETDDYDDLDEDEHDEYEEDEDEDRESNEEKNNFSSSKSEEDDGRIDDFNVLRFVVR